MTHAKFSVYSLRKSAQVDTTHSKLSVVYTQCVSDKKQVIKMADTSVTACMKQRAVVEFLVNEGVKPTDIYRKLQDSDETSDARLGKFSLFLGFFV